MYQWPLDLTSMGHSRASISHEQYYHHPWIPRAQRDGGNSLIMHPESPDAFLGALAKAVEQSSMHSGEDRGTIIFDMHEGFTVHNVLAELGHQLLKGLSKGLS